MVDHINNNKLDNRRFNLRSVSPTANSQNKAKKAGTTSKYIGVCVQNGVIKAQIGIGNRKTKNLGSFATEEEAALAYNQKALELHGLGAKINILPL